MKKSIKICIVLLSLLTVVTVSIYVSLCVFTATLPTGPAIGREKVTIQSVTFNSTQNSIVVTAQTIAKEYTSNITFSELIVQDTMLSSLETIPISESLNAFEPTTFEINLDSPLLSGTYTIGLVTARIGSYSSQFNSPPFTVP